MLERRASADVWADVDAPSRGIVVEREIERGGKTYTVDRRNPAFQAEITLTRRQREIAKELRLWLGFQTDG